MRWEAKPLTLTIAGLAVALAGCTQPPVCDALGDCGGALPVGGWILGSGSSSCSEDLFLKLPDRRLVGGDVPASRLPPPEESLSDWCTELIAGSEDILHNAPVFYVESPPAGAGAIRYEPDGTYQASIIQTGTYALDFSATCMRQFGATDGATPLCDQLQGALNTTILEEALQAKAPPPFRNVVCAPATTEPGCYCQFDLYQQQVLRGTYRQLSGNEIMHTIIGEFSSRITYCNETSRLQLTGSGDSYLFNEAGLRTLEMVPANCADGMQSVGEEGVDCGVACGTVCPTCFDGMMNGAEEGEDCGVACGRVCAP